MHLAHPDWLYHRLYASGPAADLEAFSRQARGPGIVPFPVDFDRRQEDWTLWLVRTGMAPRQARQTAGALRAGVCGISQETSVFFSAEAAPFDLAAIVPIPAKIAYIDRDDPEAIDWMWKHWGTTWALRRVRPLVTPKGWAVEFWSADWTPWPALAAMRRRFPGLQFALKISY
jgi:hypothetical protein